MLPIVFDSEKELDSYLKEHPKADRSKHRVKDNSAKHKDLLGEMYHPAYSKTIKPPKHSGNMGIFHSALEPKYKGMILTKNNPEWHWKDHLDLAQAHRDKSKQKKKQFNKTLNSAANETWGRNWQASDYKVSGIGSNEFSEEKKNKLRHLNDSMNAHADVADAHNEAGMSLKRRDIAKSFDRWKKPKYDRWNIK